MKDTFDILKELTTVQIAQLNCLVGRTSCLTPLYQYTNDLLELEGITLDERKEINKILKEKNYLTINHIDFADCVEQEIHKRKSEYVSIGGKKYCEKQLAEALANIKPIEE